MSELKLLKVFISRSVHSALVVRRTTLFPTSSHMKHISSLFFFFINEICRNILGGYVIVEKLKIGHKKLIVTLIPVGLLIAVEGRGGRRRRWGGLSKLKLLLKRF